MSQRTKMADTTKILHKSLDTTGLMTIRIAEEKETTKKYHEQQSKMDQMVESFEKIKAMEEAGIRVPLKRKQKPGVK